MCQFDQKVGKAAWPIQDFSFAADGKSLLATHVLAHKKNPGKQPGPYVFQFTGQVWDVATGKPMRELGDAIQGEISTLQGLLTGLAEIKGGKSVVLWADRIIQVCDQTTGKKSREFKAPWEADGSITRVAVSATSPMAATVSKTGELSVWDLAAGKRLWHVNSDCYQIDHLIFSPGGTEVVITGRTSDQKLGTLLLYDLSAVIPGGKSY